MQNATTVRADLYNITRGGRTVANGWRVVRFFDGGRRREIVQDYGTDEAGARAHADRLNGGASVILFAHKVTKVTKDYGEHLCTDEGLAWSLTGKAEDARGFEQGRFSILLKSKRDAAALGGWQVDEGEPVCRTVDINPHGLI